MLLSSLVGGCTSVDTRQSSEKTNTAAQLKAGEKSVTLNGVSQLDKIKPRSTWLQLQAGENEFSIDSDDASTDNMIFTLAYKQRYI